MTVAANPLGDRVAALDWYHVLELPGGVVTRGHFDPRRIVSKVPLPASLAGRRCLDVGTWDGFWAFEMERRGAHEVVAVDLREPAQWDWPASGSAAIQAAQRRYLEQVKGGSEGFHVAREALGSTVERVEASVYDLTPELVGEFDFVFLGTLLMHLRDPVGALMALRSVCRGEAVIADGIEAVPSYLRPNTPVARLEGDSEPWWWQPNRAGLHRMVEAAGWEIEAASGVYYMPTGPAHPKPPVSTAMLKAALTARGRERLLIRFLGVPHAAVRARPAR
ncbi:MAG: class I SAM-dependent methyltransferase [Solirubrobacteraceae bacterium]